MMVCRLDEGWASQPYFAEIIRVINSDWKEKSLYFQN